MGIVYAREKGNEGSGIKWILLADKTCLSAEDALTILDYYAHRWKIERLHYVLKQGLKIEDFQFDTAEKLTNAVAMYTVIAWYIMWITYYSRSIPEGIPSIIIDDTEKDILEAYTGKDIKTVLRAVMAIAILGGFIGGSKRYPHPGVKSIWIGIQKLEAMKQGWLLAKDHFP